MVEYVDELSCGEMRRYAEASERNPQCPELRKGAGGQHKLYTCSLCVAAAQNITGREAVARAARLNKGAGSIFTPPSEWRSSARASTTSRRAWTCWW
eukprot:2885628-Pyramimonas_sp.AAC.1